MVKKDNRKTANNNNRQAQFIRDLQALANKNNHQVEIYATKTAVVFSHNIMPIDIKDIQVLSLFTDKADFEMTPEYIAKYYKQSLTRLGQQLKKYTDDFKDSIDANLYNYLKDLNFNYLDVDSLTFKDLNYKTYEATIYVADKQGKAEEYTFNFKPYFEAYIAYNNEDFTDFFEKEKWIKELFKNLTAEDTYSVMGTNSNFSIKIISDLDKTKIIKEINYPDFSNYDKESLVDYKGVDEIKEIVVNKPYHEIFNDFRYNYPDSYIDYKAMLEYYVTLKADLTDLMSNPDNEYLTFLNAKFDTEMTVTFLSKEAVKNHNVFVEDWTLGIDFLPDNFNIEFAWENHQMIINPDNFIQNKNLWDTIMESFF